MWIYYFFYTSEVPLSDVRVHGNANEKIDLENIKFKAAFDKIKKYNILDEVDFEYIQKCRNEKMMEYIRNIE